jgi:hypothetical protein
MQHFLNDCFTVFPAIIFHVAETLSACSEAEALLILLDDVYDVYGMFSNNSQALYSFLK